MEMTGRTSHEYHVILSVFIVLISSVSLSVADRTFTKVYEPILGTNACFKRLNGTHEVGCRSSSKGDVGILHLIEDKHSIEWVLKDGPNPPYIAMLYPVDFTYDNIIQFRNSGRVNGVLLLKEKGRNCTSFSTDSTCPNANSGLYNGSTTNHCQNWNLPGNSLLWENLNFPIFYIRSDSETEKLLKCFDNFNRPVNGITARGWPLCASQLRSFMLAAVDTPTCLRRSSIINMNPGAAKVCDPLGDQNIWASLLSHNSSEPYPNNSIIVIAARIDGASLFDELSPAADTSITGLVTVLSIMKHLGDPTVREQLGGDEGPLKNVYFMLFNGEAFGYIGSSRIVFDMGQGNFPFNVSSIRYFIEVNQVSVSTSNGSYFLHQSELSQSKELTDLIEKHAQSLNLKLEKLSPKIEKWGLPPSSLQSFLKERPDLTGIVITNHKMEYKNKFYNGVFDDKEKIGYFYGERDGYSVQQNIAGLTATVTNTVIELLTSSTDLKVAPDVETVDELLHCYLESANCTIFGELTGMKQIEQPYATYVGVAHHLTSMSQVSKLVTSRYLGYLVDNITEDECWKLQKDKGYYWMNGSCYDISQVNSTEAKSPAFILDDYDWASGMYSTWTESIWQSFSVRIFIKPSLAHEVITLVSGILMLGISMLVVGKINEKADVIFQSRTEALVC